MPKYIWEKLKLRKSMCAYMFNFLLSWRKQIYSYALLLSLISFITTVGLSGPLEESELCRRLELVLLGKLGPPRSPGHHIDTTNVEDPKNCPQSSWATRTMVHLWEFLLTLESWLILVKPCGGGIHFGHNPRVKIPLLRLTQTRFDRNIPIKHCVAIRLWAMSSCNAFLLAPHMTN